MTVAVEQHPAGLADDCANADVLVLSMPRPKDCEKPATIIDVFDRWRNGGYALYLDQGLAGGTPQVRLETVAAHRGERPWSVLPQRSMKPSGEGGPGLPKPLIRDGPAAAPPAKSQATAEAVPPPTEPRAAIDEDPGEDGAADAGGGASDPGDAQ